MSNHLPFELGGGDAGSGSDGPIPDWLSEIFNRFPSLEVFAGVDKKAAGAIAAFGAALMDPSSIVDGGEIKPGEVAARVSGTRQEGADSLIEILVAFATDPFAFIWNLIIVQVVRYIVWTVLTVAAVVIEAIFFVVAGSSLRLQTSGQMGISDVAYAIFIQLAGALASVISLYFESVTELATIISPSTGTALDGSIRTIVLVGVTLLTLTVLYRVVIALLDAVPGLSGVQTFITGGS